MQLFANAASQPLLAVVTKALLAADLATVVSTDAHCTILDIDVPKGTKAIDMSQMTPAGASIVGHCLPNSAIARVLYRNVPQKITKESLLSHKIHGVDNTGQVRSAQTHRPQTRGRAADFAHLPPLVRTCVWNPPCSP